MTTLQEYLDKKYPTKEEKEKVEEINIYSINGGEKIEEKVNGGELDLREFKNLRVVIIGNSWNNFKTPLIKINLDGLTNLEQLYLRDNWLVSVDFLNYLPCPEKLESLEIYNNNIQPTDIAIFSRFINLDWLRTGTQDRALKENKLNKFYGSFESWKDLSKLTSICIEATDVDRGLEYLPMILAESTKAMEQEREEGGYSRIECSPHNTNAKCSAIQNELRPFNYDLEAWQLAHPEKMLISRPEYFTNPDSKEKWLTALNNKIKFSKEILIQTREQEVDKTKKIKRLETKLKLLEEAKNKLEKELTETKQNHKNQLKELTTILFPSNSDINNISFGDLKKQAEKNKSKIQDLKLALSEEQKSLVQEQKKTQQLQKELERERNKNKFLSEWLEKQSEEKIEVLQDNK